MPYASLKAAILDLEKTGQLVRVREEVDPELEMAEIHRRVFQAQGPAVFYEKVKGSSFPAVSNLYGTMERARFLFRDTLGSLQKLFRLKANPSQALKRPWQFLDVPSILLNALPRRQARGAVMEATTQIENLPSIRCWPEDGGGFILLPQVYTENPDHPHWRNSNLGMYRIQLSGNRYEKNREIGLHYQIRRDIGIHHTRARERTRPFRVRIFVGGPPAHAFAAVMYLPAGLPEIAFAGALAGRRFRYARQENFLLSLDADFCITGLVDPEQVKPEGPFGDHLGYYSLQHPFPFMKVERVYHRRDAIWPFTVVGRPPQEDSVLGKLVQEIAGPVIPREIPGIRSLHAVDESGVHPLLLAVGSERYAPYQETRPRELLTLAHAVLGYGPCSLAKYLWIAAGEDDVSLHAHDTPAFFRHMLERVDWARDLHFEAATTMDTLDYSGTGLNEGSKVVIAAAGRKRRTLARQLPALKLPPESEKPALALPGILIVQMPGFLSYDEEVKRMEKWTEALENLNDAALLESVPLIVLADDSEFAAHNAANFLWVTFTRSNPSHDIYGIGSEMQFRHWGCRGPLVIDARLKPHHASPLKTDPVITQRVDRLGAPGHSLNGII